MTPSQKNKITFEEASKAREILIDYLGQDEVAELIKNTLVDNIVSKKISEKEERIKELFSVYPDGGIHDFREDEALISKEEVLKIIKE